MALTVDGCARLTISGDPELIRAACFRLREVYEHSSHGRGWFVTQSGQEFLCGWLNTDDPEIIDAIHHELGNVVDALP